MGGQGLGVYPFISISSFFSLLPSYRMRKVVRVTSEVPLHQQQADLPLKAGLRRNHGRV